jgi:hypothetical protein
MNLGTLIDTLEALPPTYDVKFDDGTIPHRFHSWRGVYAELTLGRDRYGKPRRMSVQRLLAQAKKADGATFQGYKGGDFTMGRHTPVWADDCGEYNSRGILGASVVDGTVILATADLSDYR